jgi:hypothetical protein
MHRAKLAAGPKDVRYKIPRSRVLAKTSLQHTRDHPHEFPTFIYSYKLETDQLHWTSLVTGEESSHRVPSFAFRMDCRLSEVSGGSLLITGNEGEEVVRIDTRREFAVAQCAPMLTPRMGHTAVFHTPHLYILGGRYDGCLSECERYVCAENRWEALAPLPKPCSFASGVVLKNDLYALEGVNVDYDCNLVQKLSLISLTWELMQFRLPFAGRSFPCFKVRDTEVYLVGDSAFCSFTGSKVRRLKTQTQYVETYGASYYRRGTLYCSSEEGRVLSLEIARLS